MGRLSRDRHRALEQVPRLCRQPAHTSALAQWQVPLPEQLRVGVHAAEGAGEHAEQQAKQEQVVLI